tara:strand:+ start:38 stop:658 length:621 start_codon:yes stop_codon:yes gene_type:complete
MSFTTYSDLQTSIASYLARSDLTSQIPDFITFAENRLRRELRIRQMLKSVTTATVSGDSTVEVPSDFLEIRDFVVMTNPIQPLSYSSPSSLSNDPRTSEVGAPKSYTILASEFQLAPAPDGVYTLKLLYYSAPAYLSTSNTTNAFLNTAPDALLYASLIEAEPYLMNDARINTWGTMYDRAISSLTRSDENTQYSGVPLSIKLTAR